jgi:thioredoxin reductase (NADPH)
LVFEGSVTAGGALMNTTEVENFPGFPTGVQGPQLMGNMRTQAERFGAELIQDDVTGMDLTPAVKKVWTGDERFGGRQDFTARTVVLATGSAYRKLGIPGENELSGRGVSWCATCDGFFFREQDIAVIGGGDSAIEEATFLSRFARSVTLVHRRDALRASKIMQQRAFNDPKLNFAWNCQPLEIVGTGGKVSGLEVKDTVTSEQRVITVTGVFVAIGHEPRTALFKGQVDLDSTGYVQVASPTTQTSLPGVFACGDVVDHTYRQAITAAGTGCSAALDAERHLAALTT